MCRSAGYGTYCRDGLVNTARHSGVRKRNSLLEADRDLGSVWNEFAAQPEYIGDARVAVFFASPVSRRSRLSECVYQQSYNDQQTQQGAHHPGVHGRSPFSSRAEFDNEPNCLWKSAVAKEVRSVLMFHIHRFGSEQGQSRACSKWHSFWRLDVSKSIARR